MLLFGVPESSQMLFQVSFGEKDARTEWAPARIRLYFFGLAHILSL
jgi:hypothetical protein